ncbi:hypothetical protein FOA43_000343 [Brettanomyces nanus]|uniref:HTH APSES-type domain-containing protein n=1 Tax=Eeniella nana TaxID=13502 RepID=A0A875RZF0_EENNA|nr:uncharacterized protein FOA43_000343 [Brettanomyces nanus]QPG73039.1 hypothetical protein FOA43_000343 [Brettanomyces nanus]
MEHNSVVSGKLQLPSISSSLPQHEDVQLQAESQLPNGSIASIDKDSTIDAGSISSIHLVKPSESQTNSQISTNQLQAELQLQSESQSQSSSQHQLHPKSYLPPEVQSSAKHNGDESQPHAPIISTDATYHVTPVYRAAYSGIDVFEMEVNQCPIMRRVKDSFFNATQILKLVGLDRSRRYKLLETEIYQGPHEKVQGGFGRYQGTWIPYDRAVSLSRRYDIYDVLKPLLLYNPVVSEVQTFSKIQLSRSYSTMTEADADVTSGNGSGHTASKQPSSDSPTKRLKFSHDKPSPLHTFDHDTRLANPNAPFALKPASETLVDEKSKVILSSLFLPNQKDVTLLEIVGGDESQLNGVNIDTPIDDNGQTALHLAATLGRVPLVKDLVQRGANRLRGDDDGQTALVRAVHATNCYEAVCFDKLLDYLYPVITVLDHKGRTVLHHIAYTCGRKGCSDACKYYLETLLEWVVKRGPMLPGNQALSLTKFMQDVVNIPDRNGDTCLNIAAMVGNKHIIQQLLEVGADPTKANKAGVRPVDCGISVRWPLTTTTTYRGDSNGESDGDDDDDGNNSLKPQQNHSISQEQNNDKMDSQTMLEQSEMNQKSYPETSNSLRILESIRQFVEKLGEDFQDEMKEKTKQINGLHPTLREKTLKLSERRKQYEQLQKLVRTITDLKTKVGNLDGAIQEEDERFSEDVKSLPLNSSNFSGNFDADEPFTVWPVFTEVERNIEQLLTEKKQNEESTQNGHISAYEEGNSDAIGLLQSMKPEDLLNVVKNKMDENRKSGAPVDLPPKVVLRARIDAYKKNNQLLIERTKARRSSSQELEQQFKRVISLCIGSKPDDIDDKLLGSLLLSVENDPDPEIGQVKKVLEIVNDMEK